MLSFRGAIAGLAALTVVGAGPALADSRIFSVKTSAPGVTVEQAFRNGKELALVGRNEETTLFRIDEPSTVVGCANRFDFVTSTGEKVNLAADLCVLNWDVTVEVAAAPAPEPEAPAAEPPAADAAMAPPAAAEAPEIPDVPDLPEVPEAPAAAAETPPAPTTPPPASPAPGTPFTQVVTVSADDPAAVITGLMLDGLPVAIAGRQGSAVTFEIEGSEQGIVCQRNLGLNLADGRTVTRNVNLCLNDWHVVVALAGPSDPPPATPGGVAGPVTGPEAPGLEGAVWTFVGGEIAATLAHGVPQTDASDFVATCNRGSDRITVILYEAGLTDVQPGSPVPITFFAGSFSKTYQGAATPVDEMSGSSHPEVVISAGDPFWSALIRESVLGVTAGAAYSATISLKGSAAPTRQLLSACLKQPVAPTPPRTVAGGPGGITANYRCDNGSTFTVTYHGTQQSAVLFEPGAPPIELRWRPDGRLGRYVAGEARLILRDEDVRWSRFGEAARTCLPR
jgi:hypothetical protein